MLSAYKDLATYGPIIVNGFYKGYGGHTWIVDGCSIYRIKGIAAVTTPEDKDKWVNFNLYNCIWGYGGQNNGYFNLTPTVNGIEQSNVLDDYNVLNYYTGFVPIK